ncbi:MAG: Hpt domain-containing protein [Myxococcales bacterium]|nr:Hpt domain-containing protein [Myxococcales bacterium]
MSIQPQEEFHTTLSPKDSPHPTQDPSAPQLSTLLPMLQKGTAFEGKRTTPLNTWSTEASEIWGWLSQMQPDLMMPLENSLGMLQKLSVTQLNSWQRALVIELQNAQQKIQQHLSTLFSLSAIENKEALFHQNSFSLERCLADTFSALQEQASARGLFLQYYCSPGMDLHRKGDPAQLSRLLRILLEASLSWTERGEVVLWVESLPQAPDWLRFSLRDTSQGLNAEQGTALFKQYFPPNQSPATGLRLILAQRLCQAMGGQLIFESQPQQGAHFLLNLCLPIHHDLRRAGPYLSTQNSLTAGVDLPAPGLRSSAELDIIPPPDHLRPLKQARTLLVDPSQENTALTRFYLQSVELSPDLARDGERAIERASNKAYDLILLGTPLPDMEPWELSAKLRSIHEAQHRKNPLQMVALLHQEPTPAQRKELQQHHDAWLVRPLQKQTLVHTLQKLWKGRQAMASQDAPPPSPSKANLTAQFDALLQRYLTNLNQRIEKLREALQMGNFEEIRHIGHKLKGSGSSYGFDQITEIGRLMEVAGESNDGEASERLINELQDTLHHIQTQGPSAIL